MEKIVKERKTWTSVFKIWSSSYYVGSAGNISAAVIERYIKNQEKNAH